MDIPNGHIDRIRTALAEISSESELAAILESELQALRSVYRTDPRAFSEEQIELLQGISEIHKALLSFTEMCEALASMTDLCDAGMCLAEFNRIALLVHNIPVQRRVLREIRALRERLPGLEELAARSEDSIRRTRVLQLEQRAQPCTCGRRMVIRESEYGAFWGCETFPRCFKRRRLGAQDLNFLEGRR